MCRNGFPRLFELRDLIPDPLPKGIALPALDKTLMQPGKREYFQQIENDLQGLDALAWAAVKAKLTPWPKQDKRDLVPLCVFFDTLNEARAYKFI